MLNLVQDQFLTPFFSCNTCDPVRNAAFVIGYVSRAALATSMGPEQYPVGGPSCTFPNCLTVIRQLCVL